MASKFQEKLAREAFQDIDEILDNAKNKTEKTRFTNSLVKQVKHLKRTIIIINIVLKRTIILREEH